MIHHVMMISIRPGSALVLTLFFPAILSSQEGKPRYPWPFDPQDEPKPVSNSFHALQDPTAGGPPYFHGGIDIRMAPGTPILAISSGHVSIYRENHFDNIILTELDGNIWEYRHVEIASSPSELVQKAEGGELIHPGAVLGRVPRWGYGYDHIHLNRRTGAGCILNPLEELVPARDHKPPEIRGIHFLPDGHDIPFADGEDGIPVVRGDVDIAVDVVDRMDDSKFVHPPVVLTWRVGADGPVLSFAPFKAGLPETCRQPVPRYPRENIQVAYLCSGPLASHSKIPLSNVQRFVFTITNVDREGKLSASGCWRTSDLADGEHVVEVSAIDQLGGSSRVTKKVMVRNGKAEAGKKGPAN
jgi:hypothetical protein